ncbi:MAG: head-tail connector protein [Sarcina sp.]
MIMTLEEAKEYARVDASDDDNLVTALILAAEEYLFNATGIRFTAESNIAVLYCKVLVYDWYTHRQLGADKKVSDRIRYTLTSMMAQLQNCGVDTDGTK